MRKVLFTAILILTLFCLASCTVNTPRGEDVYYQVTFGGEGISEFSFSVKSGENAVKPEAPQAEGKEFGYWATEDGTEYDFSAPVEGDIALHAVWKGEEPDAVYYTVKFYGVKGELISVQQVEEGKGAINPAVTVSDFFVFDGWSEKFDCITGDLEVYAREKYVCTDPDCFFYVLNSDMTYTIIGVKDLPEISDGYVKLALPAEYNGGAVTAIADGSNFRGIFTGKNIISLYIPGTYRRIGAYAFYGNPALMNITFCEGLTEIGEGAFMATLTQDPTTGQSIYNSALTRVDLPASLSAIGAYAFNHIGNAGGVNYHSVTLGLAPGSKLQSVGAHAFEGAMIYNIDLSSSSQRLRIDEYAFAADTSLFELHGEHPRSITNKLNLPKTTSYIGNYAFYRLGNMSSLYNGTFSLTAYDIDLAGNTFDLSYLGKYAFYGAKLKGDLQLRVDEVGDFALYGQMLSSISLVRVVRLGSYSFARAEGNAPLTVDLGLYLRELGTGAFSGNAGLTSVEFPSTLISIGAFAFSGCNALSRVVLPESVSAVGAYAFSSSGVESIEFKGEVKLMRGCFENSSLKTIKGKITEVEAGVFGGCKNLTSVTLPDMTELPEDLLYGCQSLTSITLPPSLMTINRAALGYCSSLKSIVVPENVTAIGNSAFEHCTALVGVKFEGDNLKEIDSYAFAFCMSLTHIDLPDSVGEIGSYAFQGSGLTSFKTPASLTRMGKRVFYREEYILPSESFPQYRAIDNPIAPDDSQFPSHDMDNVNKIYLPELTSFTVSSGTGAIEFSDQGTFDGAKVTRFIVEQGNEYYSEREGILYDAEGKKLIMYIRDNSVTKISVPEDTTVIAYGAFYNNPYLAEVTFPQSLEEIEDYAFVNCTHLRAVKIPASVKRIGKSAFRGSAGNMSELASVEFEGEPALTEIDDFAFAYNKALRAISIPKSLITIGREAFYSASALASLDLTRATSLESIGELAFGGDVGLVPKLTDLDFSACASLTGTGRNAFVGSTTLKNIDFGTLDRIDAGSFDGCTSLVEVTVGAEVEEIGANAFHACTSLKNIIIPEGSKLKRIMFYAFSGAIGNRMSYTSLDLTNALSLESIGDYAFALGDIESVVLPRSSFTLGADVFNGCNRLASVDFGTVTEIGENVFRSCVSLQTIDLPESLTSIKKDAFRELDLVEVTIRTCGSHDLTIGMSAFFGCGKLKTVNITGGGVPKLVGTTSNYAFHCQNGIIEGLSIIVDAGRKNAYVTDFDLSGWGTYKKIISERAA